MESFVGEYRFVLSTAVAGLLASLACGAGVFPLLIKRIRLEERLGFGYGFAGGLMFAASVYNLLLPALSLGPESTGDLGSALKTVCGMGLGCAFLWWTARRMDSRGYEGPIVRRIGGRTEVLIFLAMCLHSVPEGIAVGVGYASESHLELSSLGGTIAVAIGVHNIPEGLAVALPMRVRGASILRCFVYAFLTSLPQPIAGVPASLLVWFFEPLMIPALGFAAGAMMYLVIVEIVPDGMESGTRTQVALSFMSGFAVMALVQVGL